MLDTYDWSRPSSLQLARYAEFLVMAEFLRWGLEVYSTEVDERGIDLLVRNNAGNIYDFQVKSSRNLNYIFFRKETFAPRNNLYASVVLLMDDNPAALFLIPSTVWAQPTDLFVSRDYEGLKSKPEWGLNLSQKNLPLLEPYRFPQKVSLMLTPP